MDTAVIAPREEAFQEVGTKYGRRELDKLLPHAGMARFIDEVVVIPESQSALGVVSLLKHGYACEGHFHICPGHWMLEFSNLTGLVLAFHLLRMNGRIASTVRLLGADGLNWSSEVRAQGALYCEAKIVDLRKITTFSAEVYNYSGNQKGDMVFSAKKIRGIFK